MSDTQRKGHQVWKQRHAGVRTKELLADGEQRGIENPLHAGKIDLGVLSIGMVAVCQQRRHG